MKWLTVVILITFTIILSTKYANSKSITIINDFGNKLKIETPAKRCVVLFPQALPFFYMLHAQKCLVGYPGFGANKTPFYSGNLINKVDPNFKKRIADVGYPKAVNIEELLKLHTSCVVNVSLDKIVNQYIQHFNIPVVRVTFGFGNLKEYIKSVKIIGEVTGHQKDAERYINFYLKIVHYIKSKVKHIKNKPKVLYLSYEGPKGNKLTSGGKFDTFVKQIITIAGGKDVSKKVAGFFGEISEEDILKWNPDYIILGSCIPTNTIYKNSKLRYVSAVKEKRVYTVPCDGNSKYADWFSPEKSPLGMLWLAKTLHPLLFNSLNLKKEIKKYYKYFWGLSLKYIKIKGNNLWIKKR